MPWPASISWSGSRAAGPTALFERNRPMHVWMTRYFKSLDQEEITVAIHPETGKVTGFGHTIPETRPGADLTPERAREIASQFAARFGWDTGAMELKESDAEKKKARRDYSLEWEAPPGDRAQCGRNALARGDRRVGRPGDLGARLLETARRPGSASASGRTRWRSPCPCSRSRPWRG